MTENNSGPARATAEAEVAGIVEGMSNVEITYPFEEWATLAGPSYPTQKRKSKTPLKISDDTPRDVGYIGSTLAVEMQEVIDQVMEDHHNNPIQINPDADTSDPFFLESFIQGIGDLTGDNRELAPGEQDNPDGEITEASSTERRVTFNLETGSSSPSDNDCHSPGEEGGHWGNLDRNPYTRYRCDPGDRIVVDSKTKGARVLSSLCSPVYSQRNPPANQGLAPREVMIYQCPANTPRGHRLDGRSLNRVSQAPRSRKEPYDLTRGRGDTLTRLRQPREMSSHGFLSPASNTHAQGGPNFRTRTAPRDTTPMRSPPLMGVGALVRGHTRSLPAQRPEYSQHTWGKGSHPPSEVVFREQGAGKNQLFQFKEGKWFRTNNHNLKNPEWAFDHICGLRLGPRGWPQINEVYQHIWPLNSIREADHLMQYSTLVASSPEDTRRYSDPSIIHLSRKLFFHLPTRKRFCILEGGNGRQIIYLEQPQPPSIWDWAPTSAEVGPPRPWRR